MANSLDFRVKNGLTVGANATLGSNVYITGTANAAAFTVGSSVVANSSGITGTILTASQPNITANNASYLGGTAAASYQLNSTLAANVATLTANNTTYVNGKTEGNLNVNSATSSTNANNTSYLGGTAASGYQTTAGLSANVATLSANNTTYLNGQLASYYTNATNIATGTLPWAQAPTGTVNTSGTFTFSGAHTYNANVTIGTSAGIIANGSIGTAGQVLTSNATTVYWASPAATGVTSVATSNGIGGGTITTTGTLYAVAGVGAVANSTGIHVNANSGIVANSTGTFVNSAYIATISANNTTYVNGKTEGNLNVNNAASANAILISSQAANSSTFYPLLASGTSSAGAVGLDSALSYVPSTDTLTVGTVGATTITGNNLVTGTLVAGSGSTGSVTMGNDSNGGVEIGTQGRASSGSPFIDFHSAASSGDYDVRVQATGGNSTPGWGVLTLTAGGGLYVANTSANMLNIGSTGVATFAGTGGVYANNLLLQGDGTNAYIRPTNSGSALYLGSNNTNQVTVAATGNLLVGATVNAASHTVGTSFVANTSQVTIAGIPLSANGGVGTSGQVLTSNGATGAPYWSTVSSGTTYTFSTGLINTAGTITVNSAYIATISSNNASYLGGVAAASYALRSDTQTHTSSNSTAFSATATSAVALQVGDSSAIRNTVSTGGTMYFDVGAGGATTGSFVFRTTSSFTTITTINGSGTQTTSLGVGTAPSGTAGVIRATNNITSFYSDGRLKNIHGTITNPVEKVKKLSGVYYTANEIAGKYGYDTTKTQVGVIAQEVQSVLPEIVVPAPFDIDKDEDGNEISKSGENYKTVQYEKLVPLLIEAIKEQAERIEQLENKLKKM